MTAKEFQQRVTRDKSDFLYRFLEVLRAAKVPFCVIGGQAVNAYAEPLVSLDLDVVVVSTRLSELETTLRAKFQVQRFEHSLNVSEKGSDLRVQIQTDERYQEFLSHSRACEVLGRTMPVASVEDVLKGKLWAYQDATRRGSKRQKDLADIARLLESHPDLTTQVPEAIRRRIA